MNNFEASYGKCEFEKIWETRCGDKAYRTNSCALHVCKFQDKRCSVKREFNEYPSRFKFPFPGLVGGFLR